MIAMFVASRLTRRVDGFLVMVAGLLGTGWSILVISTWIPYESQSHMMLVLLVQGFAMGLVLNPMIVMAFSTLQPQLRNEAVSVQSLCRTMSFAAGISLTTVTLFRNTQVQHTEISAGITPFQRTFPGFELASHILDPTTQRGAAVLNQMVDYQARVIAYNNTFRLMALTVIPPLILLFFLRRGRARIA